MPLFVKVIPLRTGTSEPAGEPHLLPCPPDVKPDTVLSFLTRRLGKVIATLWTSTERHQWIGTGWVFSGTPAAEPQDAVELACVPFIESADGPLQPMFEVQAGQCQQFAETAASRSLDYTIIQWTQRAHQPADRQGPSPPHPRQIESVDHLDQTLADIAHQTGATLRTYPRPGHAARRIVLRDDRDDRDDRGTRYLDATLELDGTLRITGHDQGLRVSEFFGEAITSYEWVYVIAPGRIPALTRLLGGHHGDDVLAFLAAWHEQANGQLSDLMQHPDVAAHFSNWHS